MCAIFGLTGHQEAAHLTYLGLHALQHRGQEGAGIVSTDGQLPYEIRKQGLVSEIFHADNLAKLKGRAAIGHTRYSTSGGNTQENLQPMLMKSALGWVSIAHNGNLTNAQAIARDLGGMGSIFQSTSDTEVVIHLMARSKTKTVPKALVEALKQVEGAFSLLVLSDKHLVAVRDPYGFRPLVLGKLGEGFVFASETTALNLIQATYVREVEPGEMIIVPLDKPQEMQSLKPFASKPPHRCIFEFVYLARPDSQYVDHSVHEMRKAFGRKLALEQPAVGADLVIPVPDSGVPAAIGFAETAGIPFDMAIIRSHYIGRTFIEPQQSIRDFGVKLKLSPVRETVKGKSVVVVDDSLVRGTTSRKIVHHLRDAGAREVHVRISAPPTTHSCFYGVDTPTKGELLASSHNSEEICRSIGADSLGYLSLGGLLEVAQSRAGNGYCHACFSGEYPV